MDVPNDLRIISLPNRETLSFLRNYHDFLKSIFIKKLKSFTTIGGFTDLVSANSILKLELTDDICMMINAIITKLPCYNTYSGLVISKFLMELWFQPYETYGIQKVINAVNDFREILVSSLESMKIEQKDFDLKYLQLVCISLLLEEPSILLNKNAVESLSLQIVKAILSVVEDGRSLEFGLVGVHVERGADECFAISGVLCEIDDNNVKLVKRNFSNTPGRYKMLLFSENLNFEDDLTIIDEIIKNEVKVIFSQKKVSDLLKITLRRKNVVSVERVGEDLARAIELLTGASPVSDPARLKMLDISSICGLFTNLKITQSAARNLMLIENNKKDVAFIYIKCQSFSDSYLIKKVVNDCLHLLKSVLSSPYYLPRPVAFEESLIQFLNNDGKGKSPEITHVIIIFRNFLTEMIKLYKANNEVGTSPLNMSFVLMRNALLQSIDCVTNILSLSHIVKRVS